MSKLAILGGVPVRTASFPGWPCATQHDEDALLAASPREKNGNECSRFAMRYAKMCNTDYCIPVANGTVSIELILRGLGIGYGDEVILPAYTFIATLSSVTFASATPVFADIESGTYNICAESIEEKITERTKAIIAVAVGGRPCDFEKLEALAKKHGIYLIVDAAQAVGAEFLNQSIGRYGVAASFSCQNSKNLTCGEGGIITTNDKKLYDNICSIIGINPSGTFLRLEHGLTEMQAALLNSQLDKLPDELRLRSENAAYLESSIAGNPILLPMDSDSRIQVNAYHVHLMRVNFEALKEYDLTRNDFINAVNAEGFPLSPGYRPLYSFPCTASPEVKRSIGREIDLTPLPVCERAGYLEGTWIYHSTLLGTRHDMEDISNAITKVCENIEDLRR